MTKTQWERIASIVFSAVLAIVAVLGWVIWPVVIQEDWSTRSLMPAEEGASEFGIQSLTGFAGDFGDIYASSVTVGGDATVGGTLTVSTWVTESTDLILSGDLAVGDGTPDVTQDGEDAYVEGQLEVDGEAQFDGAIDANSSVTIDGSADEVQATITGFATQTNYLLLLQQSDGSDKLAVSNEGHLAIDAEPDADTANYDNMFYLHYAMTGVGTKDRNYGLVIEGSRAAGQELTSGDHDEAGLKIRVDTHAVTTTAGTVLRGMEAEAKADNPDGTVSSLYGGSFTAKSDTSAGLVDSMIGLTTNVQNNEAVTTTLISADFRLMRQAATEPTSEYVVQVRNSSTSGTGADAGIYVTSDYSDSVATDDMDYGIDFDTADITTAEVRLSNGETINNVTDTAIQVGGFLAYTEGGVIDLGADGTITPSASYQPITNSTDGSINTSATTAIADGVVAGQILILINEDAQDIVIKDAANTQLGGDITLTGGADDSLMLIWDGTDWTVLSMHDN